MIIDARTAGLETIRSDVCVIGGGAAGITVARALAQKKFRVCLVESGGANADADTQALYQGDCVGLPYNLAATRLRFLGGTTGHWGGCCWPIGSLEFGPRSWIPESGWPFERRELEPYYEMAQETCEIGPFNYDTDYWSRKRGAPALPFKDRRVVTTIYQNGRPPPRFGTKYWEELKSSERITCILHGNATVLARDDSGGVCTKLEVRTLEGQSLLVESRIFVLAAGGLENPRLLLLNDIGNQYDLVGRYFMEHPGSSGAKLALPASLDLGLYIMTSVGGTDIRGGFALAPEVLEKEGLLSSWLGLDVSSTPASRLADSWDQIASPILQGELPDEFGRHVRTMLRSLRQLYRAGSSDADSNPEWVEVRLGQQCEQAPNPASRVMLSDDLDALGQRKIKLDWRLTDLDHYSMRRTLEIVALELGRSELGRLMLPSLPGADRSPDESETSRNVTPQVAYHHMGTTRMSRNPRTGVVDEKCRVFGTKNLYVAGSSVFPVCGYYNPTLTIVAMAYRLADHLSAELI